MLQYESMPNPKCSQYIDSFYDRLPCYSVHPLMHCRPFYSGGGVQGFDNIPRIWPFLNRNWMSFNYFIGPAVRQCKYNILTDLSEKI